MPFFIFCCHWEAESRCCGGPLLPPGLGPGGARAAEFRAETGKEQARDRERSRGAGAMRSCCRPLAPTRVLSGPEPWTRQEGLWLRNASRRFSVRECLGSLQASTRWHRRASGPAGAGIPSDKNLFGQHTFGILRLRSGVQPLGPGTLRAAKLRP